MLGDGEGVGEKGGSIESIVDFALVSTVDLTVMRPMFKRVPLTAQHLKRWARCPLIIKVKMPCALALPFRKQRQTGKRQSLPIPYRPENPQTNYLDGIRTPNRCRTTFHMAPPLFHSFLQKGISH